MKFHKPIAAKEVRMWFKICTDGTTKLAKGYIPSNSETWYEKQNTTMKVHLMCVIPLPPITTNIYRSFEVTNVDQKPEGH